MTRTDDELMARVRAGDAQAFTELYERHGRPVLTFLARLTADYALAEDLLQETFVRLYRARAEYEATGHFRAFLFTIARRLVIDWRRGRKLVWADEPAALENMEGVDRAEHRAEARELAVRLEAAIQHLPVSQREIVLLSRYAGLSTEEIARVTGSTPGAVRVGLHRALHRLRQLIEPPEPPSHVA